MDDKFYVISGDGEEMPSDFYQAIKGIEMPVMVDDEKRKIEYLIRKTEELMRESSEKTSAEWEIIRESLLRMESLLQTGERAGTCPQEVSEKLEKMDRSISEKIESSSHSLDSIEKSLADLEERVEEESRKNSMLTAEIRSALGDLKENILEKGSDEAAAVTVMAEEAARDIKKDVDEIRRCSKSSENIVISLGDDIKRIHKASEMLLSSRDGNEEKIEIIGNYLDKIASFIERIVESSSASAEAVKDITQGLSDSLDAIRQENSEGYSRIREKMESLIISAEERQNDTNSRLGALEDDIKVMASSMIKVASSLEESAKKTAARLEDIEEEVESTEEDIDRICSSLESSGKAIDTRLEDIEEEVSSLAEDTDNISTATALLSAKSDDAFAAIISAVKDAQSQNEKLKEKMSFLEALMIEEKQRAEQSSEILSIKAEEISEKQDSITDDIRNIEKGNTGSEEMMDKIKDVFSRQEVQITELSAEIEKSANDQSMIMDRMKELSSREELHLTEIMSEMEKTGRDNMLLSQKLDDNMNALKAAIEYLANSHSVAIGNLASEIEKIKANPKTPNKKRKDKPIKTKRAAKAAPKPAVVEESIAKMDRAILNALAAGKRRGVELTRIVKGDSKLFRTRLRMLVSSGKILVNREGKLVYYMLG